MVSVADSLSPLCDALLGSNKRAEFKVIFEIRKPFILWLKKYLYFLEEVVWQDRFWFFLWIAPDVFGLWVKEQDESCSLYGVLILIGKEIVLKTISSRSDTVSRFESEGHRH